MIKRLVYLISNVHIKKFFGFSLGSFGGIFFSYLATSLLNKTLTKGEMGHYSYVFNLVNLAFPVISLSMSSGYVRFIGIYREDLLVNFVKKSSYISTLIFCMVIIFWFSNWYFVPFAFVILYQEQLILTRAKLDITKYNFLNIIQKILFLFILLLVKNNLSADMALLALGISYVSSLLIILIWRDPVNPIVSENKVVDKAIFLKFCIITMFTVSVNWMLTVSDQVIIEYYYGYESLAPYSVAYRIITMLGLLSGIFLSYYPGLYFKEVAVKNIYEVFLLRKCFILILIFSTLLILLFKKKVYFIFGAGNYIDDSNYFLPLLLGEMCRIMASVYMTFMTFKLQQAQILFSMLFVSILNICLNIIFVPLLGPLAAAYSTLFCFLVYLGIAFLLSYVPELKYIKSIEA